MKYKISERLLPYFGVEGRLDMWAIFLSSLWDKHFISNVNIKAKNEGLNGENNKPKLCQTPV